MDRAVSHLVTHHSAGLPLRPGARKTSITLAAFCELQRQGVARTMLVVAPLRVARQTWRQEAAKWEQFRHLTFVLLHGAKKAQALKERADIYLINPEGVAWLCQHFLGRSLPFDVVVIDELTRFKNSASDRSKALRPRLKGLAYRWGLTGSLAPNGYMDLFGQMLMLDDGAALGRFITHYRDQYFHLDYNGFDYELSPGSERRIIDRIAPYWFQCSEDEYAQLPPLVQDIRYIDLEPAARKSYERMKADMLAELPEGTVTAANAAATYSKLAQMASGAVYVNDKRDVALIHEGKIEALDELAEELAGEPLLVAYEFNHDLARIQAWHFARFKKELPYLGSGTTAKQEEAWLAAWNRGALPVLAAHPASAGHGLNMQGASAAHVAWFGLTWDLELYDQLIRRIRRDGTEATQIWNHLLIVRNSIDELKLAALEEKDTSQTRLLEALNSEVRRGVGTQAPRAGGATTRSDDMVFKLSRPGGAAATEQVQTGGQAAAEPARVVPRGWGKTSADAAQATQADPQDDRAAQAERIQQQIAPADAATTGQAAHSGSAFSGNVAAARAAITLDHEPQPGNPAVPAADKPPRTRRSRAEIDAPAAPAVVEPDTSAEDRFFQRSAMLHLVLETTMLREACGSLEDVMEAAETLFEFASR